MQPVTEQNADLAERRHLDTIVDICGLGPIRSIEAPTRGSVNRSVTLGHTRAKNEKAAKPSR